MIFALHFDERFLFDTYMEAMDQCIGSYPQVTKPIMDQEMDCTAVKIE